MKKSILTILAASVLLVSCSNKTPGNPPSTANGSASTPVSPSTAAAPSTPMAATPAAGEGEVVMLEEVGLKYSIPAGWKKVAPTALTSADEKLVVVFIQPPEGEASQILNDIANNLDSKLKDVVIETQAAEHEINGLDSFWVDGSGTTPDGKKVEFSLELIMAGKPIILLEMAEAGAFDSNAATFDAFESSLEKVDGPASASVTPGAEESPGIDTAGAEGTETPDAAESDDTSETPESAETP